MKKIYYYFFVLLFLVFFLQPVYGVDCAPSASGATFTVNGSCSFVGGTTAGTAV